MTFDPLLGILLIPLGAAALLATIPNQRLSAALNIAASLAALVCAATLPLSRPPPHTFLMVDDFNIVFILLNTFVAFTTSIYNTF